MMKKILIILLLGGCVVDPVEHKVLYTTRNVFNLEVEVLMYRSGQVDISYQIAPKEEYAFGLGLEMGKKPPVSVVFSRVMYMDSVKIKFADGKVKTDYLEDYKATTLSSKSIYRDDFYTPENSCGKNCSQYIYFIDEQDYAEAK